MSTNTIEQELDRAHEEVLDALRSGDRAALDRLITPDCQVVGPKGFCIGKEEWIAAHTEDVYVQVLLEVEESQVREYGDTAVRCDLQRSECLFQGSTIKGLFRVLNVWVRQQGQWRLAAIQYTAVAPEADPGRT